MYLLLASLTLGEGKWSTTLPLCLLLFVFRIRETFNQVDSNPECAFAISSQIPVCRRWKYSANIYRTLRCFPSFPRGDVCLHGSSSLRSQENKSGPRLAVTHLGYNWLFSLFLILNFIVLYPKIISILLLDHDSHIDEWMFTEWIEYILACCSLFRNGFLSFTWVSYGQVNTWFSSVFYKRNDGVIMFQFLFVWGDCMLALHLPRWFYLLRLRTFFFFFLVVTYFPVS